MARIAYPDTKTLPAELRELLNRANLNIFLTSSDCAQVLSTDLTNTETAVFARPKLPIQGTLT